MIAPLTRRDRSPMLIHKDENRHRLTLVSFCVPSIAPLRSEIPVEIFVCWFFSLHTFNVHMACFSSERRQAALLGF